MKDISLKISELRKGKGWEQGDLAKRLGKTQSTISNWENGRHFPKPSEIQQMADLFGVDVSYLLGLSDKDTKQGNLIEVLHNLKNVSDSQREELSSVKLELEEARKLISDLSRKLLERLSDKNK